MKSYRYIYIALVCFIIPLINSCTTSVLVNQWSDPSFRGPALTNILVVAVRNDPIKRRVWEDAFVGELSRHGLKATQSYQIFSNAIPDSNQIEGGVAQYHFDGIIITRRLPKVINTQYVNGYVSTESETKYSQRRQQFFTYYHDIQHPGYVDTIKIANRTIEVWTTDNNGRMIWSAVSKTAEPATPEDVHRDIVNLVTADLEQKGIIPKGK